MEHRRPDPVAARSDSAHPRTTPVRADEVRQIIVRVSTSAADKIDDSVMANLSMQYLIAVMLIDGSLSFTAAHDNARMREPAVLRRKPRSRSLPTRASSACCHGASRKSK
jgi:2-methylcitrate dehydratase PrpD